MLKPQVLRGLIALSRTQHQIFVIAPDQRGPSGAHKPLNQAQHLFARRPAINNIAQKQQPHRIKGTVRGFKMLNDIIEQLSQQIIPTMDIANGINPLVLGGRDMAWLFPAKGQHVRHMGG